MKTLLLATSILMMFVLPVSAQLNYYESCDDAVRLGTFYNNAYDMNDNLMPVSGDRFKIMMNQNPVSAAQYTAFDEKRAISGLAFAATGVSGLVGLFYGLNAYSSGTIDPGYMTANVVSFGLFATAAVWNYMDSNQNLKNAVNQYNRLRCGEPEEPRQQIPAGPMILSMNVEFRF